MLFMNITEFFNLITHRKWAINKPKSLTGKRSLSFWRRISMITL